MGFIDADIAYKLQRLLDEIWLLNRGTGKEYYLFLVPVSPEEEVVVSFNGKQQELVCVSPQEVFEAALAKRRKAFEIAERNT